MVNATQLSFQFRALCIVSRQHLHPWMRSRCATFNQQTLQGSEWANCADGSVIKCWGLRETRGLICSGASILEATKSIGEAGAAFVVMASRGEGGGGRGELPYISYIGMFRQSGYHFHRVYNFTFSCLKQGCPCKSSPFLPLRSHNRFANFVCLCWNAWTWKLICHFYCFEYGLLGPVLNRVRNYSTFSQTG